MTRIAATAAMLLLVASHLRAAEHTFSLDTSGWDVQPGSVHLAGDFNGWSTAATPMHATTGKLWSITVDLEDGPHAYKFVADAGTPKQRWLNDPKADKSLDTSDGNGGNNSGVIVGVDATKLPPAKPNDVNMDALRFDPNSADDFSAVDEATVRLRVRTLANDATKVQVAMRHTPTITGNAVSWQLRHVPLQRLATDRNLDVFSGLLAIPKGDAFFTIEVLDETGPAAEVRESTTRFVSIGLNGRPSNDITSWIPLKMPATFTATTPAWTHDAVWYQIFVERFRNGDPANDPGDRPYERLIPWNADWWKTQPNETPGDENFYRGTGNVWNRRYGGDLAGVREKLPYLRSLGVNALYLNPIFEAESMHKYDTADFRHVDDNFGVRDSGRGTGFQPVADASRPSNHALETHATMGNHEFFNRDGSLATSPETDDPVTWKWTKSDLLFLDFIKDAHEQGFRVIIDGVFNHVGRAHPFFQDVLAKGKRSKYADWFEITDWGDEANWKPMADPFAVHGKPGGIQWNAWDGKNGWLPNFREDGAGGLARGPRDHLIAIAKRWGDPDGDPKTNDGIDGWRLDAANEVPHAFWIDFRKAVRAANPDAYITGEIWGAAQPWVSDGKQFDAVMNYQFAMAAQDFFVDQKEQISPTQFNDRLVKLWFMYPAANVFAMQNLFDSHDTDRVASMLVNPDRPYDGQNRIQDNAADRPYDKRKPNATEWKRLMQMVAFQHCFAGAPMTYYGDEAGMWSPDDPSNRQPLPWPDKGPYATGVGFNDDVFAGFQRFIAIRNALPPLRDGDFYPIKIDDAANVYAFARERDGQVVYVVLNRSAKTRTVELSGVAAGDYVDYADPASVTVQMPMIQIATARPVTTVTAGAKRITPVNGATRVEVPAYGTMILAR